MNPPYYPNILDDIFAIDDDFTTTRSSQGSMKDSSLLSSVNLNTYTNTPSE